MTIRITLGESGPGMTADQIDAHLAAATGGFTSEQLDAAFTQVQNADHWRNPIDAVVSRDMIPVLDRAIPYYTGTAASFEDVPDAPEKVRVTADGYFLGPCN